MNRPRDEEKIEREMERGDGARESDRGVEARSGVRLG